MTITTHTTWGREFTSEELEKMEVRRAKLIDEGVVYSAPLFMDGTQIREWATQELAQGFVEFANSFNPPPEKIEIVVTDN